MMKKIIVSVFLAVFGLAMANVTFAQDTSGLPANCIASTDGCNVCSKQEGTDRWMCSQRPCSASGNYYAPVCTAYANTGSQSVCTEQYEPVCGYVQVQCIKAPCYPVAQTFSNTCEATKAHATAITSGECGVNVTYNHLANTSWTLQSFDGVAATASATLSFSGERFSAKLCNSQGGEYTVTDKIISTSQVISTMMACAGIIQTYENAFDLSGATYELSTDGGNHLMITTHDGHTFQWQKPATTPVKKPVQILRRYGLVSWQIDQLMRANKYETLDAQKEFLQSLIDNMNRPNGIMYTRQAVLVRNYVKKALQYYSNHLADEFAQCLTDKGVVEYGADRCPHCQAQKEMFGVSFEKITYVECTTHASECEAAGVTGYPTWVYQGQQYQGEQSFQQLADMTQCSMGK